MKIIKILLVVTVIITVISCSKKKKENPKSMEEIQREAGIPVEIETVNSGKFTKYQNYFAELKGEKETTVYAKVTDRIKEMKITTGAAVNKDDVILTFPKNNSFANYYEAKAQKENLEKTLQRARELFKAGGISQQQVDDVQTQYKVAERSLETIIEALEEKAPYDGVITKIYIQAGEHIFTDDPLYTISNLNKLKAIIWVNEDDIDFVKKGMPVHAIWKSHKIYGKVSQVALAMDSNKKAFRTEVIFDNFGIEMKAGITAKIDLELFTKDGVISIDREFIKSISGNPYVWVEISEKAKKKYVELGLIQNNMIEINNGLSVGDKLITKGHELLEEGKKLQIEKNDEGKKTEE